MIPPAELLDAVEYAARIRGQFRASKASVASGNMGRFANVMHGFVELRSSTGPRKRLPNGKFLVEVGTWYESLDAKTQGVKLYRPQQQLRDDVMARAQALADRLNELVAEVDVSTLPRLQAKHAKA